MIFSATVRRTAHKAHAAGFRTLRLDLRGCGVMSPGLQDVMPALAAFVTLYGQWKPATDLTIRLEVGSLRRPQQPVMIFRVPATDQRIEDRRLHDCKYFGSRALVQVIRFDVICCNAVPQPDRRWGSRGRC